MYIVWFICRFVLWESRLTSVICISKGYKQRDGLIVTQMSLPTSTTDFWAMIYDHDCRTIIMMNEMDTSDIVSPHHTLYTQEVFKHNLKILFFFPKREIEQA